MGKGEGVPREAKAVLEKLSPSQIPMDAQRLRAFVNSMKATKMGAEAVATAKEMNYLRKGSG